MRAPLSGVNYCFELVIEYLCLDYSVGYVSEFLEILVKNLHDVVKLET